MIDNSSIEALKSSIDIVDIVGSFIELKKSGANYKANCPFHGEETPSFVVSPAKQIYHCFGCGVGGDSIKFVMELEKLNYPEAIEKIASLNNFSLSYTQGSDNNSNAKWVLEAVREWYIKNLNQNQIALEYLHKRGINQNSIEKFNIGFVPKGHEVMNFLQSALLPLPKALDVGIIAPNDNGGGYYARLIERIIFPIYSASSSIVGFGGRTITNHPAKYINSPQTKLFNKSQLLYGYHLAKEHIYKNQRIIICEGYLDVVAFHQAGFTESVASMGTALTPEHLPLLRKGDPKVILAYDGDKAGINAGIKASKMLSIAGFDGGIILFGDGEDPADMIANGKSQEVATLLRENKPFIPFVVEMIVGEYDLSDPRAKEVAFEQVKEYLNNFSQIIKDAYIPMSATLLKINPSLFIGSVTLPQKKPQNRESISQPKDDVAHLSIIKTLIENPSYIDNVLDVMDISMFGNYGGLFASLIEGDLENSSLVGLSIDERFNAMSQDELNASMIQLLTLFYREKLRSIPRDMNIPSAKKAYLVKKIKIDVLP
ncbi:MAG: DNA primase, partial [Sulfurovum sp.]